MIFQKKENKAGPLKHSYLFVRYEAKDSRYMPKSGEKVQEEMLRTEDALRHGGDCKG